MNNKETHFLIDPLSYSIKQYPIAFLDYLWVITLYSTSAFFSAVILNKHLLSEFDKEKESKNSSYLLGLKIILQLALQGFIAVLLCGVLLSIPSPVTNIMGYNPHTSLGLLLRNPAIISVLLLILAKPLQERLMYLYNRFNKNI
jgi:membrane protease YdiL (CAAX protease family)